MMDEVNMLKALKAIMAEAKKNKPDPDKIFALASGAISKSTEADNDHPARKEP